MYALGRDHSEALKKAQELPFGSARDLYWQASDYILQGRVRKALPILQEAVQLEPTNFWAWFVLGNCFDRLQQDMRAEACYDTCIALWPEFSTTYFNRGLARLRQKQSERAVRDFDEVVKRQPSNAEAYINRALAKQGMKNDRGLNRI